MNTKKCCVQITEEEYNKYLKSVEEMERLILIAQASCEHIERMKIHSHSIRRSQKSPLSKVKRIIKIASI